MLGDPLGRVIEFTSEPAVSSAGIVSNVVAADQPVYAVQGHEGRSGCRRVSTVSLRVFQRVGYGGTAIVGGESLGDVLLGSAQVVAMELSDVGVIDDPD